jgi:hypothetical protein
MQANIEHKRILVLANETVESPVLRDAISAHADPLDSTEVAIVAPALNSRLRHWLSDEEEARTAAELRLARCVNSLAEAGIESCGWVGDPDPVQAIVDELREAPAVLLIVSTHPEGRSNWLSHGIVERARRRFGLAVVHIVVDLDAEREYLVGHSGALFYHARLAEAA